MPLLREEAKERQRKHGDTAPGRPHETLLTKSPEVLQPTIPNDLHGNTRDIAGKAVGVSGEGEGARGQAPGGEGLRGGGFGIRHIEALHALQTLFVVGLESVTVTVEFVHHGFGGEAAVEIVI